jgi:hypothetical protein
VRALDQDGKGSAEDAEQGGLRKPYLMPARNVIQEFAARLLRRGIPEIDDLARPAGPLIGSNTNGL